VEGPDEVLLHELVHATRKIRGVLYRMSVSGGYGNQEEFLATLVANMYRSEKGLKQFFDYGGRPINPGKFLDAHLIPTARLVLGLMHTKQPSLFSALAGLPPARVPFNPIRQVEAEKNAQ
jgi:hypothetical protein